MRGCSSARRPDRPSGRARPTILASTPGRHTAMMIGPVMSTQPTAGNALLVRHGRVPSSSRPAMDRRNAPRRRLLFAAVATAAPLSLLARRANPPRAPACVRPHRPSPSRPAPLGLVSGRPTASRMPIREGHHCERRAGDHRERDRPDARRPGPGPARPRRQALAQHLGAEHERPLYRRRNGRRSGRQDGHGTEHVSNTRPARTFDTHIFQGFRKTYGAPGRTGRKGRSLPSVSLQVQAIYSLESGAERVNDRSPTAF
jgi:hypothetical protein